MKKLLIALVTIFTFSLSLAQERTTSEVKRDFEKEYKTLMKNLRDAGSADDVQKLSARVEKFENEYKQYQDFLNKAVFPDGYDETLSKLKDQLAESKTLVESKARIAELEAKVAELTGQVDSLNNQNAKLFAELTKYKSEISKLTKQVKELSENIKKRDEAVFALVDSLFARYDASTLQSGDMKKLTLLQKSNVLANIKRSVEDNMKFLSFTTLSTSHVPKLYADQRKFESYWKGVATKLAAAYVNAKDREKEIEAINGLVAQWHTQADEVFWKTLSGVFSSNGIAIDNITSGDDFYNKVTRYIDDQINIAGNKNSEENAKAFDAFVNKTWNGELKASWLAPMKEYGMITDAQTTEVETKIMLWAAAIKPSNTLLYGIIGALILAIMVGVFLGMRKKQTQAA